MRASSPLSLLVLLAVLAGGCGGDGGPPSGDQQGPARAALERFYAALGKGDAQAACAELTPAARKATAKDIGEETCAAAFDSRLRALPPEVRERLGDPAIERVRVEGEKGTAMVRPDATYTSSGREATAQLRFVEGEWRVAGLPAQAPDPVTACVVESVSGFDKGDVDPFWEKEGRRDFLTFVSRYCKGAEAEGLLDGRGAEPTAEDFERVEAAVLRRMIREGRITAPK